MTSPRAVAQDLRTLGFAMLALMALLSRTALGNEFKIEDVDTYVDEGSVLLDARIDYAFTPQALEALDNGVPLTIEVYLQVRRADAWIWEDSLADIHLRYAIRYKPLSEQYEVYRLPGDRGRGFISREAAIAALGEIEHLQLVDVDRLDPDERYEVQIKVALDIEELPLPLRPMAYLSPSWKLESPWTKWPLTPDSATP